MYRLKVSFLFVVGAARTEVRTLMDPAEDSSSSKKKMDDCITACMH